MVGRRTLARRERGTEEDIISFLLAAAFPRQKAASVRQCKLILGRDSLTLPHHVKKSWSCKANVELG